MRSDSSRRAASVGPLVVSIATAWTGAFHLRPRCDPASVHVPGSPPRGLDQTPRGAGGSTAETPSFEPHLKHDVREHQFQRYLQPFAPQELKRTSFIAGSYLPQIGCGDQTVKDLQPPPGSKQTSPTNVTAPRRRVHKVGVPPSDPPLEPTRIPPLERNPEVYTTLFCTAARRLSDGGTAARARHSAAAAHAAAAHDFQIY